MSLQIWLPLTKDLRQQGLSRTTANGGIISNNGKLGQCYLVNSSNPINITHSLATTTEFSFAFWMKIPTNMGTNTGWEQMIRFNAINVAGGSASTTVVNWASYQAVKIYDDSKHQWLWAYPGTNFSYDKWHHWSITHTANGNGVTGKVYIDGILIGTYNNTTDPLKLVSGTISFGTSVSVGDGFYLNDIRIYDHCLSPMEVKELAKGLVLHYPLSQSPLKLTLQYDTNYYQEPDGSVWVRLMHHNNPPSNLFTSGSTWTTGVYKNENAWYDVEKVLSQLPSTTSRWEFMVKQKATSDTTLETKYRWYQIKNPLTATWEEVNPSSGNAVWITGSGYANYSSGGTYILNSSARMIIANGSKGNWWGSIGAWNTHQSGIPAAGGVVVTTGYMDLYFKVADNSIEYDCSGFGNNGTRTNTFNWVNDTSKYTAATFFTDYTQTLRAPLILNAPTSITLAVWVKGTVTGRGNYQMPLNIDSGAYEFSLEGSTGKLRQGFYINGTRSVLTTNSKTILDGQWHHLVATYDGTVIKRYVDGAEVANSATSISGVLSNSNMLYIGTYGTGTTYGNINLYESDVRIYVTALSASDVLSLYQNNAYIDSSGTIYGKIRD